MDPFHGVPGSSVFSQDASVPEARVKRGPWGSSWGRWTDNGLVRGESTVIGCPVGRKCWDQRWSDQWVIYIYVRWTFMYYLNATFLSTISHSWILATRKFKKIKKKIKKTPAMFFCFFFCFFWFLAISGKKTGGKGLFFFCFFCFFWISASPEIQKNKKKHRAIFFFWFFWILAISGKTTGGMGLFFIFYFSVFFVFFLIFWILASPEIQKNQKNKHLAIFLIFLNFGHLWEDNWWNGSVFFFFFDFFEFWQSLGRKLVGRVCFFFCFFLNFGHLWEENWWEGSVFFFNFYFFE